MFGSNRVTPEVLLGLSNLARGNTPGEQVANAGMGVLSAVNAQKERAATEEVKNKTAEMLQVEAPDIAVAVRNGAMTATDGYKQYLERKAAAEKAKQPKFNFMNVNGRLIRTDDNSGNFQELGNFPDQQSAQNKLGLNPQYGVDEQGNPVLLQMSPDGQVVRSQLPDGVKLSKEPIKLDAGTHFVLMDPVTRQNIGTIPKDIAGVEQQKVAGKMQGENLASLPDTIAKSEQALSVIDKAISHPGREKTTGLNSVIDPRTYIPGTDSADFQAVAKQIEGKAFLEAFESLKGGGQITEVEGQKATQAIARLSLAQSDDAYKQALLDLREVVESGLRRARSKVGDVPAENPSASINSLVDKYRSK